MQKIYTVCIVLRDICGASLKTVLLPNNLTVTNNFWNFLQKRSLSYEHYRCVGYFKISS